jgi:hypothetical protein
MHPKNWIIEPFDSWTEFCFCMHTTTHGITHNVKAACFLRIILAKVFEPHVLMSLNLVNHVRDANPTCRSKRGLFRKHILVWKAGSGQLQYLEKSRWQRSWKPIWIWWAMPALTSWSISSPHAGRWLQQWMPQWWNKQLKKRKKKLSQHIPITVRKRRWE